MNRQDTVLVIVVTYNGEEWIERCLDSVRNSSVPAIPYIVDNGSTDKTLDIVRKHYKEAILIEAKSNLGFGKANNLGLQYAKDNYFDYVYLLNQDAWVETDTIEKLINVHQRHKEYGILSPMQLTATKTALDSNFAEGPCSTKYNPDFVTDLYFDRLKEVYPVPDVMAAHWLVSIECLKDVGGFSPSFPHYGEDNNYVSRTLYWGYKVGIVPSAIAIHDRSDRPFDKSRYFYINCFINPIIITSDIASNGSKLSKILAFVYLCTSKYGAYWLAMKYLFKYVYSLPCILKNKKLSLRKSAFLR